MSRFLSMFLPVLLAVTGLQAVAPIPFAGKVALNGRNHDGLARFAFSLEDLNGTVLWRNGADVNATIEVPVSRGRYLVLLGGQGMNALPADLFHQNSDLSLRVRVDLKDGFGLLPLSPVHRVSSSPKSLASELAKLAERATVADTAAPGSVTLDNFSPAYRSGLSGLLSPSLSAYAVDGLTPKFPKAHSAISVPLGKPFTLQAPETPGKDLTYSWKRNGESIEGADGPELSITGNEAEYSVTASNALGSTQTVFSTYGIDRIESKNMSVWRSSFYVDSNGTLWGAGENSYGKLGVEGDSYIYEFIKIAEGVVSVSEHEEHVLFIKANGSLWGMGRNHLGQLGDGTNVQRKTPTLIVHGEVLSVCAGRNHSLFVMLDGSLWGMGGNEFGQLGSLDEAFQLSPIKILDAGVASASAGNGFSFAVMKNGSLLSFGRNDFGQLGDGTTIDRNQSTLVRDSNVTAVSCGNSHTVFMLADGSVWSMGKNERGQLGVGGYSGSETPRKLLDNGAVSIGTGFDNTYYLMHNGELWGVGANRDGQLGIEPSLTPEGRRDTPVKIASDVHRFASGGWSLVYAGDDGRLWGLGYTGLSQFAIDEPISVYEPQTLLGITADRIEVHHESNALWNQQDEFWVSGNNEGSKLMLRHDTAKIPMFVKSSFKSVRSVSGASNFSLLADENGSLWSVGDNSFGQLGIENVEKTIQPIKVVESGVSDVSARQQVLYIKEDGSLWGMGRNHMGQLGDGTTENRFTPVKIVDANVTAVATGFEFSLFLKSDGSVWSMGGNRNGRLGIGEIGSSAIGSFSIHPSPKKVFGTGAKAIAAGGNSGYLLLEDGSLWAFGSRGYGKLGEGKVADRRYPIKVVEQNVDKVSSCGDHVLFVKIDGSLWGMGRNHRGQLGNDAATEFTYPIRILDSGVKDAKAGVEHSLVLKNDGTILFFGSDLNGQLASGRKIWTSTPYPVATGLAPKPVD